MEEAIVTPETVETPAPEPEYPKTRSGVLKLEFNKLQELMKLPGGMAKLDAALQILDPTPEEIKAAEEAAEEARLQEKAAADEAERVAAEKAEAEKLEAEKKVLEEKEVKKKLVVEYQATDENGNPIGNKTHLEAHSNEELIEKMKNAHIQATRAFHRLKNQKVTFKEKEATAIKYTDEQLITLAQESKDQDPAKAVEALRKLADIQLEKEQEKVRIAEANAKQREAAFIFMSNHVADYNRCKANGEILGNYLQENNLDWTPDNLEIAFLACQSELAPVPSVVESQVSSPADNPAPSVVAAVAVPSVEPNPPAPVVTPAVPVVNTPALRPGVNTGIVPGQTVGTRPGSAKPAGLTKKDIAKMSAEDMRRRLAREPGFREKVNALFAAKA